MTPEPRLVVLANPDSLAEAAAREVLSCAGEAVRTRGRFSLALSGGSTPGRLFEVLAREPAVSAFPWGRTHIFWADERCVPPDHPDSNYRLARDLLLSRVPVPARQVHRMQGEADPETAARKYEDELRRVLAPEVRLDLVLLGLGGDGHTASLFPGTPALLEEERLVVAHHVPAVDAWRMTLTLPAINRAREVAFLVAGQDKAPAVARTLELLRDYPRDVPEEALLSVTPAAGVRPDAGQVRWLLDTAAAGGA